MRLILIAVIPVVLLFSGYVSPVRAGDWSQDAHDAQRTGFTPEEPLEPWTWKWSFNGPDTAGGTGGHFYQAPKEARTVTGAGLIFVPAGTNGIYALDLATGTQKWNFKPVSNSFDAAPAYDPATNALYAGGSNGYGYKLDAVTGSQLGSFYAGSAVSKAVMVAGGYVYVTTANGQLHKVSTDTGISSAMQFDWTYQSGSATATPPAYSPGHDLIIFATADLFVHAVYNTTASGHTKGTAKWKVKPSPNPPGFPNEFNLGWPVIAENHGIVFLRMRLSHDSLSDRGIYPNTNAEIRSYLSSNPRYRNLFALDLATGADKFIPAVGYGSVEGFINDSPYGEIGSMPVVKVTGGQEVAYIHFRNGSGSPPDYRWDGHMGEMVLDGNTVSGLVAGDMRFVKMNRDGKQGGNSYTHIVDEQCPITLAGDTLFHAHWGASESVKITDRTSTRGLTYTNPILTTSHPSVIRRQSNCSNFNPSTHWTTCGLTLFNDGRYWDGPGWWTYWNTMDPPGSPQSGAYSAGILPRYTYVARGYVIVEGNGGDLSVFKHSGVSAPTSTPVPTGSQPTHTPTLPPAFPVPGDANNDTKVDGVDYTIWLLNYEPTGPVYGGVEKGDFSRDYKVDGVDYTVWLLNYNP